MSEKCKLVDVFNGWEGSERFDSPEEAEPALERQRKEFYRCNTKDTYFCVSIVPADAEWQLNCRSNRFEWRRWDKDGEMETVGAFSRKEFSTGERS